MAISSVGCPIPRKYSQPQKLWPVGLRSTRTPSPTAGALVTGGHVKHGN